MPRKRDPAAEPKKRGPKPGFKRLAAAAVAAGAATAQPVAADVAPPQPRAEAVEPAAESSDCLQRGRNIDRMPEAELRRYARQLGISQRDADGLAVERLRQNCTAQLYELIDAL